MLPSEAILYAIDIYQIKILQSNRYKANLNDLQRKEQPPPNMVVTELNARNFEKFDLDFKQEVRRLVGGITIPLDYVLGDNKVGNYEEYWSRREEILNNCVLFNGETYRNDS